MPERSRGRAAENVARPKGSPPHYTRHNCFQFDSKLPEREIEQ